MAIEAMSHVGVWVRDQEEAKSFYTEKLGFTVHEDRTLEDFGNYRWLTVGPPDQPDLKLILSVPGPPAVDAEAAGQLLELVSKGALGGGIFRVGDCRKACAELEQRGVELVQEPEERFYGVDAEIRDPSGNLWRLVEPIEY